MKDVYETQRLSSQPSERLSGTSRRLSAQQVKSSSLLQDSFSLSDKDDSSSHESLSRFVSPPCTSRSLYHRTESQPSNQRNLASTRSHALSHQQDLRAGHTSPLAQVAVNVYKGNRRMSTTAPRTRTSIGTAQDSDGNGVGIGESGSHSRARTYSAQHSDSGGGLSESSHYSRPRRTRARTLGRAQTLGRTLALTSLKGGYDDDYDYDDSSSSGYDGSPLVRSEMRQNTSTFLPTTGRELATQQSIPEADSIGYLSTFDHLSTSRGTDTQDSHSLARGGTEQPLLTTPTTTRASRSSVPSRATLPLEFAPRQDVRNFGGSGEYRRAPARQRAQSDCTTRTAYYRLSLSKEPVIEKLAQPPVMNDATHDEEHKDVALRTLSTVVSDVEGVLDGDGGDGDDWMESFADVHMASDASAVSALDEEDFLRSDSLICALPAEEDDPIQPYELTEIMRDLGSASDYEKSVYERLSKGMELNDRDEASRGIDTYMGGDSGGYDQFSNNLDNNISNSSRNSAGNVRDDFRGMSHQHAYAEHSLDPHDSVYDNIVRTHDEDGTEITVSEDSSEDDDGAIEDDENTIGLGNNRSVRRGKLIGSGAFGKVYQGLDTTTGSLLVIKQVDMHGKSAHAIRTMEKEIQMLSQLDHRHIVKYLGAQIHKTEILNIFLEFVSGGSVADMLVKFGPFSVQLTSQYTRQLLYGLSYLHRNGIAHLDIKGGNVLIDKNGVVKLADFGNSVTAQHMQTENGGRTELRGTPNFMAPEVVRQQPYGSPADIWSVGCTVMEMLMGKPPWSEYSEPVAMLFHIARSKEAPQLPEGVGSRKTRSFLERCFVRDPAERATVNELVLHEYIVRNTVKQFRPNKTLARKMSLPVDLKNNTHQNTAMATSRVVNGSSRLSRGGDTESTSEMQSSDNRRPVGNTLGYAPSVPALGSSSLTNQSDASAEGTPQNSLVKMVSSGSEPESDDGSSRDTERQKPSQLHLKPSRKLNVNDRSRLPRSPLTSVRSSLTSENGLPTLQAPRSMSTLPMVKLRSSIPQDFRPSSSMSSLPGADFNIDEPGKS